MSVRSKVPGRLTGEGPPRGWLRTAVLTLAFSVLVLLLMLWLTGFFHSKVAAPDRTADGAAQDSTSRAGRTEEVRTIRVPQVERAVGSVRAVYESAAASKLLARVRAVQVAAGQRVARGDLLVELDDVELRARVEQAEAAVASATAVRDQARTEWERVERLFAHQSAAPIERDRATTALTAAQAGLTGAEQALQEARTVLGYARIVSPLDGVVVDKRVEAGDTVSPGQTVATLLDPTRMQLVAAVRESLSRRLQVGQTLDVEIDALGKKCQGIVSEIVPEAQSQSRTFLVKVTGPCPPGVYSGMFGRLLIPTDEGDVLVAPRAAVRRVGQLDLVDVVDPKSQAAGRRIVQLGRDFDTDVEVLSGLRAGEIVALPSNE